MSDTQKKSLEELLVVDQDLITTSIDEGIKIIGNVTCNTGKAMLISGEVEGEVSSNGAVIVNESGSVKGSIHARSIKLAGRIEKLPGSSSMIVAEDVIVIAATGHLAADELTFGGIKMDFGCHIDAKMSSIVKNQPAKSAQPVAVEGANVHTLQVANQS